MGLRVRLVAGLIFLAPLTAPGIAAACTPVRSLPGETPEARTARLVAESEAYERERQRDLWAKADRIFTARVKASKAPPPGRAYHPRRDGPPKSPKRVTLDPSYWKTPLVFEPVQALKGTLPSRSFDIVQTTSMTSCGYIHRFDDGAGSFNQESLAVGEVVVVFLKGPYSSQSGLLGTLKPEQVVDPALTAALARAAR